MAILGDEENLRPLGREAVQSEMHSAAQRREDVAEAVTAIRAIRRRELLRISVADLTVPFGVAEVGYALTDVASATLEATLAAVVRGVEASRGEQMPTRMAIVAMGRYGGFELGYGSDADVMFVHDPLPGADPALAASMAQAVANDVRRLLSDHGKDPVARDRRRPASRGTAGAAGAHRSRPTPPTTASGRRSGRRRRCSARRRSSATAALRDEFAAMIDPLRFPAEGLSADGVVEVRRIKARVDAERLPRGADPHTHLKLGPGGLSDIEWTVQLLQMRTRGRSRSCARPRRSRRCRWPSSTT